ncbi:MAG TPA: hypothetical protein VGF38_21980 [Ktedonobacterales bacterium]
MAITGRRIDAEDADQARFPPEQAPAVQQAITSAMRDMRIEMVVSSAACGADLLALNAASELKIPFWIVLPFDRAQFRETSVVDRGGDWGEIFDKHMDDAERRNAVRLIDPVNDEAEAYRLVLDAILDLATTLASRDEGEPSTKPTGQVTALAVWDGASRGADDFTAAFIEEARQRGILTRQLTTLR